MFVCDTLGSGGAERVICTLSNEFVKRGHELFIVILSKEDIAPFYKIDERIKIIFLTKDISKKVSIFKKTKLLKECVKTNKADVVISFLSYVCIYTWWALKNTGNPYIVSERNDPNQRSKIKQFLLNKSFKKAADCVFQTEDAKCWYKNIVGNKGVVIRNPVQLDCNFEPVSKRKNKVVFVGRFSEQKNLFMLIDAFKIFSKNHNDYLLRMYGNGILKKQILGYIVKNGLNDKVELLPSSNEWQTKEKDAKLFVLPSKYEGMPNVLAEALCLGIPSVSTNCTIGGPKELKNVFGDKLVLSQNLTALSFADAMEEALSIELFDPSIPDELSVGRITDEWLERIMKVMDESKRRDGQK